jgi:hypothetical protein
LQVVELEVPFITGGRVMWETPAEGLRIGGSFLGGAITGDFIQLGMPVSLRLEQTTYLASLEYTADSLVVSAEYGRAFSDTTITRLGMPAMTTPNSSESMYAMASYRLASWVQPAMYYSLVYPNVDMREGRNGRQHDAAISVRFDITPNWILKLEGHSMRGTASVQGALNAGEPLANRWYLAAAKTTVYF